MEARLILPLLLLPWTAPAQQPDLALTLPPAIHAVPGVPLRLFYDNLVLTEKPEAFRFEFDCPVGTAEQRAWRIEATDDQVGTHPIRVTVRDANGTPLASAETRLQVAPRQAGAGRPLRLLIIGDSLTNASQYPNEMARWFAEPGNPNVTFLGTHHPSSAQPNVSHEGYGGWTWAAFLTRWNPQAAAPAAGPVKRATSPFLFAREGEPPVFDLPRYFRESCDDQPPDVVTFLLGINDCFSANPDDPKAIDTKIDGVLAQADQLLAAFHAAAPQATLAVGLTTAPNARESGFEANYKGRYHRWGWKRIQHRLVQRMIDHLANRESEGIHLVATELVVDPVEGYPENNGVHPNAHGYAQIGTAFYSWIKAWCADADAPPFPQSPPPATAPPDRAPARR
ncbi:MAG: SGNH/GDSL hydrolase family protein [Verrucomicrobiales bacterium]|nr:SGNH/GDSL hydrolase family protein [Verrucomicrobiales bacterium]